MSRYEFLSKDQEKFMYSQDMYVITVIDLNFCSKVFSSFRQGVRDSSNVTFLLTLKLPYLD